MVTVVLPVPMLMVVGIESTVSLDVDRRADVVGVEGHAASEARVGDGASEVVSRGSDLHVVGPRD